MHYCATAFEFRTTVLFLEGLSLVLSSKNGSLH